MRKNSKQTEAARAKIAQAMTGLKNPFYGKRHGPETRKKISRSVKRTWKGAAFRKRWREARWGNRIQEVEHASPRNDA